MSQHRDFDPQPVVAVLTALEYLEQVASNSIGYCSYQTDMRRKTAEIFHCSSGWEKA